jgi:hypothetical protein
MKWIGQLIRVLGVCFALSTLVLLPGLLSGSGSWKIALAILPGSLLIAAMLIGIGNRMVANLPAAQSFDPLSLTPNSPQQRVWHSILRTVWQKVPALGLLWSIVLIVFGGLVLLGGLIGWARVEGPQPSQIKLFLIMALVPISAGFAGLVRLRRASMEKVIEKLRGGASQ